MRLNSVSHVRELYICLTLTWLQSFAQFSLETEHLNKRLLDYTVANRSGISLAQCAQICMFTQQCVSLNYCASLYMCELNALHSVDADPAEFVTDNEWNYANITAWPERISRTCENKTCAGNEECVPTQPEAFCRTLPGCSVLGSVDHASLKHGGTLVNTTRTYTCESGYAAIDGTPTIEKVCQSDETWTKQGEICHLLCSPGSYSTNGFEPCTICPMETFQPNQGETSCQSCPPGTITLDTGRTASTDCKVLCTPGTYSNDGIEPCTPCSVGYYQPISGHSECLMCSEGLTTQYEGSSSNTNCKVYAVQQWVSSVVEFSSEFSETDWCAAKIIGEIDVYPGYGDYENSWAQKTLDADQYIEVSFETAVFISGVDIYETLSSGGIKRISMRDGLGELHVLWETTQVEFIEESRIFSPNLLTTDMKSSRVRLDIDCTLADNWVEIDAVKLRGTNW